MNTTRSLLICVDIGSDGNSEALSCKRRVNDDFDSERQYKQTHGATDLHFFQQELVLSSIV